VSVLGLSWANSGQACSCAVEERGRPAGLGQDA
jgi:hypothetical protein